MINSTTVGLELKMLNARQPCFENAILLENKNYSVSAKNISKRDLPFTFVPDKGFWFIIVFFFYAMCIFTDKPPAPRSVQPPPLLT